MKLDKGDFLGRDALRRARAAAGRRLACLVLDDPRAVVLGSEPVRLDGEIAGRVTSGGYGYTRRALDRLRLPARPAVGPAGSRWRSSAAWVAGRGGGRAAVRPDGGAPAALSEL